MQRNGRAILQTEIETSIVLQRMSLQTKTMCKIFSYIQFWHRRSLPTHHCLHPQRCARSCLLLAQHHSHPQCCPCSHSSTFQTHIRHPCISVLVFFFSNSCAFSSISCAFSSSNLAFSFFFKLMRFSFFSGFLAHDLS